MSNTLIDTATLASLLGTPALALIDCRFDLNAPDAGRAAFLDGHIPGARHADLNRDLSGPPTSASGRHPLPTPAAAAATFTALGIGPGVAVVAYDAGNGMFAARLWWMLRWLGFTEAAVLDGGFTAWLAAGGAVERGAARSAPERYRASPFEPRPAAAAVLDAAQVAAALADPGRLLVDARAPERFSGEIEPLDPVAGHVPGAVNHPFALNLGADGRFLTPDELARRWRERLADVAPRNMIAMCGSGVTACHNLLALEYAGLPGGALYAGSWSEWIRDPRRPVARGP